MSVVAAPASTSRIPGTRTLAKMTNGILNLTGTTADSDNKERVRGLINDAIDEVINIQDWHKLTGYQDIALVDGDSSYELDGNVRTQFHLERLDSDDNPDGNYNYLPLKNFLIRYPVALTSSYPDFYTVDYNTRLLIFNYAVSSGHASRYPTARLHHSRRLPHLVAASDFLDAPSEYEACIQLKAGVEWLSDQDPSRVRSHLTRFIRLYDALKTADNELGGDWGHSSWGR